MRRNNTAPPGPVCRCVNTAIVQPRIGNWLNNPVSGPPNSGATTVIVAVTPPAIAIRAGRSQRGGANTRRTRPVRFGQYRTISPIPATVTTAPAAGGNATTRTSTASPAHTPAATASATGHDHRSAATAYPRSNPAATSSPGNEFAATEPANPAPCVSPTSRIAGPDVSGSAASSPPTTLPNRRCDQVTVPISRGESRNIAGFALTPRPLHRSDDECPQKQRSTSRITENSAVDSAPMDAIDRDLLTALVHDGRMTYQELARTVRLSANAVAERIRRLKETGLLLGYHAHLDPRVLGRSLRALTDVRLREGVSGAEFESGLRTVPQVVSAAHITGDYDYLLDIACVDPPELEFVVELIKREHGARELRSRIVLRDIELDPARILQA